jgi:hypothetical protein
VRGLGTVELSGADVPSELGRRDQTRALIRMLPDKYLYLVGITDYAARPAAWRV